MLFKTLVLSKVTYAIQLFGNSKLTKIQLKLDKIIKIIYKLDNSNNLTGRSLIDIKTNNRIWNIDDIYNMNWIKLTHDIIYNSYNLPQYFKNLIHLTKNRNGLLIETKYRKSKYGDNISYNIMQNKWNDININTRNL